MHGEGGIDCDFCDRATFQNAAIIIEGEHTFFASGAIEQAQLLPGGGIICPRIHRETPFDLTIQEWAESQDVLRQARAALDERLAPDGYNLIWNVGPIGGQEVAHVHLHLVPRFHDEPLAGRGARWHLKQEENRRPDPLARGRGGAGP